MDNHIANVRVALQSRSWTVTREVDLQDAIEGVFTKAGIKADREVRLCARSRADFLTAEGLAIEVKIKGGMVALVAQVCRYAEDEKVNGVLAVVSRRGLMFKDLVVEGKPVRCCLLPTM